MSEPIRVLHIGDVHLGVELYGRPDPEKGFGTRVGDFLKALDQALSYAEDVDLVLFPGDIYKNCDPSPTVQREFAGRIRQVARHRPVILIPGNHDVPNAFARATSVDIFHTLQVENVYVLRRPELQPVQTPRGEVLIAPLPFLPRSRLVASEEARSKNIPEVQELMRDALLGFVEELADQISAYRDEHGNDVPAILMAHYPVQGAVFGGYGKGALLGPEVELPLGVVRNPAFDYVALAHIHQHQYLPHTDRDSQPPIVYPGSIERIDFGEENEDKVVVRAEVKRGETYWEPLPLHPRTFVTIRAECDDADPLAAIRAAVEARRSRLQGAVVRVIYTLPAGHPNVPERDIRALLAGAHFIAGIRRETIGPEHRARHGSLTTQLTPLQALEAWLTTQPQLEGVRQELIDRAQVLIAEVTEK